MERRFTDRKVGQIQTREQDGAKTISGYAAVFYREGDPGTEYELMRDYFERVDRGAFDDALRRGDDVRALFNHDDDNLLGRRSSGTLRLSVDDVGLRYEVDIDEADPDHARVVAKIARGDLTGSSFAFMPESVEWREEDDRDIRILKSVRLYDVGPVAFPAYESSTTQLRDGSTAEQELAAHRERKGRIAKVNARLESLGLTKSDATG